MNLQAKHNGLENIKGSFIKDKVPFYLLILLSFFPIMPFGLMSVAIILFVVGCIVFNFKNFKYQFDKVGVVPLFFNIGFFLLLLFSLVYSENLKFGWRQIERALPLLFFPIVFLFFPPKLTKKQLYIIGGSFVSANILFIVLLFYYLVQNASDYQVLGKEGLILFEGLKEKSFFTQLKDLWNGTFYEVLYYANRTEESFLEIHKTW